MLFYPDDRIALFIDGANLYSAARSLGFDIDYKRLLDLFVSKGRLIRAFYYTAVLEEQEYSPIRPLVDWLDYNGYTLVTKPAKEFTDGAGRRKVKGNMDIELAVDMMTMVDLIDHVVLFSGDGDFRSLISAVQNKGVRASIVSSIRTQPPMIADELRRQADQFIELDQIASDIERIHQPDRGDEQQDQSSPSLDAYIEPYNNLADDYIKDNDSGNSNQSEIVSQILPSQND
ncbi:hypothetical protein A1OE_578 [Candidatus Endolissoclinum faulkneri L2]|uniref:NYN domain-containing protein n=1 Tax=Candidatus Endolissoclinum faulkneri L2 TaxID=1193729 RepID=K7YQD0_9PROT|nr:NYN domain-containing protein [Candidatus Endolissoclinum faulkneri]AFX98769.1 hypothetical protein A1OE_578 [Candidatus Endolissoclinum faulkneri L2]